MTEVFKLFLDERIEVGGLAEGAGRVHGLGATVEEGALTKGVRPVRWKGVVRVAPESTVGVALEQRGENVRGFVVKALPHELGVVDRTATVERQPVKVMAEAINWETIGLQHECAEAVVLGL